jgi:hypothetical protein
MGKRKPGMRIYYSKREHDFVLDSDPKPEGRGYSKPDQHYVNGATGQEHTLDGGLLSKKVLEELERRGYDTKKIRISIPYKDA